MASTSLSKDDFDPVFSKFYAEVKDIEKRDAAMTPKDQINRLLRPGHKYFNLNPFEVLRVDPKMSLEEMKKIYRRMSILVHPDRNPDDKERAEMAFDILKKAIESLEDPDELDRCRKLCDEAVQRLNADMLERRRALKRENKPVEIDEDDPVKYNDSVWKWTVKTFADRELRRKKFEERANEEKLRYAEEVEELKQRRALEKEYAKNFEESREERVASWSDFTSKKNKKKKKLATYKPPKMVLETRTQPVSNYGRRLDRDRRDMF